MLVLQTHYILLASSPQVKTCSFTLLNVGVCVHMSSVALSKLKISARSDVWKIGAAAPRADKMSALSSDPYNRAPFIDSVFHVNFE